MRANGSTRTRTRTPAQCNDGDECMRPGLVCANEQITDEGISLVENLELEREPMGAMEAIYFVSPTYESMKRICADFANPDDPKCVISARPCVHVYWRGRFRSLARARARTHTPTHTPSSGLPSIPHWLACARRYEAAHIFLTSHITDEALFPVKQRRVFSKVGTPAAPRITFSVQPLPLPSKSTPQAPSPDHICCVPYSLFPPHPAPTRSPTHTHTQKRTHAHTHTHTLLLPPPFPFSLSLSLFVHCF